MCEIEIKRVAAGQLPMDLVYEADESRESVADYIGRGWAYVAYSGGNAMGEYILIHTRPFTCEIVNIAVAENFRGRGIGKRMVSHAIGEARARGFRILEVATGNCGIAQIAFYQRCGFAISHLDHGYIERLYPEPIIENGIVCRDMVLLRMEI